MQEIVKFAGADLVTVKENDKVLVALKPICTALSLDYSSQVKMVRRDETLKSTMVVMTTVGGDGRSRDMLCLPVDVLQLWLAKLRPSRVKDETTRQLVIKYQTECALVLHRHFEAKSQAQAVALSSELLREAELRIKNEGLLTAAYIRYQLKRIQLTTCIPARFFGELAMEAEQIPQTCGNAFESAIWDTGTAPEGFMELVARFHREGKLGWLDVLESSQRARH